MRVFPGSKELFTSHTVSYVLRKDHLHSISGRAPVLPVSFRVFVPGRSASSAISFVSLPVGLCIVRLAVLVQRLSPFSSQALVGSLPWGMLLVYLHDFLRVDAAMGDVSALIAVGQGKRCGVGAGCSRPLCCLHLL